MGVRYLQQQLKRELKIVIEGSLPSIRDQLNILLQTNNADLKVLLAEEQPQTTVYKYN